MPDTSKAVKVKRLESAHKFVQPFTRRSPLCIFSDKKFLRWDQGLHRRNDCTLRSQYSEVQGSPTEPNTQPI
ncbi:Hypothetical protein FKW44_014020 [Caligus rogercresseyi]|uniref:Uncharacterized protein n=1 Tax=Caligus rogercresseyi TaxID=217165 RepID=A0A7T8JYQ3_CALRO|nr:Hypothetical protein FKW44_014020 [Caligus rogercresseyi]